MNILIVNDDMDDAKCHKADVESVFPNARIAVFDNLLDAANRSAVIDLLIIDISAVCPVAVWDTAYGPICSFLNRHPGATVIIASNIGGEGARIVREEVLERVSDADVRLALYPHHKTLPLVLKQIKSEQVEQSEQMDADGCGWGRPSMNVCHCEICSQPADRKVSWGGAGEPQHGAFCPACCQDLFERLNPLLKAGLAWITIEAAQSSLPNTPL